MKQTYFALLTLALIWPTMLGCQSSSSGVIGNEGGSEPINDAEAADYKRAVVRCYKTGGTRVVKIMGVLRCY